MYSSLCDTICNSVSSPCRLVLLQSAHEIARLNKHSVKISGFSPFVLQLPVLLRVGCIGLVCTCNAVMWTVFAKALRLSSSSATASVTTTASNFISSAILGKLLFGETWTPVWWVGLAMTLCGLFLLHTAAPRPVPLPAEKKET
uniref:Transmembrane protein 42 n=1 Tax=Anas zonorhyncha TaxID=75864 RepID=A0A8B9UKD4_9AVES